MNRLAWLTSRFLNSMQWARFALALSLFLPVASGNVVSSSAVTIEEWQSHCPTYEPMNRKLETLALQQKDPKQCDYLAAFDLVYPRTKNENQSMDGNAILYVVVMTKDKDNLPLNKVFFSLEGNQTFLPLIHFSLSDLSKAKCPPALKAWPYRIDALYLLPVELRRKPGDLIATFANPQYYFKLTTFSNIQPPWLSAIMTESNSGQGPSEMIVDKLIREELPGVLDASPTARTAPGSPRELEAICARGRALANYDQAAWHASDAVTALNPMRESIALYIATVRKGRWTVSFGKLNDKRDRFIVYYEAVQGRCPTDFLARRLDKPKEEEGFLLTAAKALLTTRKAFGSKPRPYNAAVLPAGNGQVYVYLLPAQTESGIFPFGGDTRYLIAADGTKILERHPMHRVINEFKPSPTKMPEVGMHTAVLDEVPEDSDVFHALSRSPSVPEWVVTPRYVYLIDRDGSISYQMTTETFWNLP